MTKKNKDVAGSSTPQPAETPSSEPKRAPVKSFLIENVSASIFARERVVRGQMRTFYSVSFTRSYKDASGQYKYTKSFDVEDLGALVTVAQQASEYLHGLTSAAEDAAAK
jgi:hypothetical protein